MTIELTLLLGGFMAAWALLPVWQEKLKLHCCFLFGLAIALYVILGGYSKLRQADQLKNQAKQLSQELKTSQGIKSTIATFQTLAVKNKTDPQAWYWLGRMHMRANDSKSAAMALEKAYALAPDLPIIAYHYAVARITASNGKIDDKSQQLLTSIAKIPAFSRLVTPWLQHAIQQNAALEKNSFDDAP